MEIMRGYLYCFNFLRQRETNAQQLSIASYSITEIKISQEGTFRNESIACNTQTYHSLFRTNVYVFNEIMKKRKENSRCLAAILKWHKLSKFDFWR